MSGLVPATSHRSDPMASRYGIDFIVLISNESVGHISVVKSFDKLFFIEEAFYCREYIPALSKIYTFFLEISKQFASQDVINYS